MFYPEELPFDLSAVEGGSMIKTLTGIAPLAGALAYFFLAKQKKGVKKAAIAAGIFVGGRYVMNALGQKQPVTKMNPTAIIQQAKTSAGM